MLNALAACWTHWLHAGHTDRDTEHGTWDMTPYAWPAMPSCPWTWRGAGRDPTHGGTGDGEGAQRGRGRRFKKGEGDLRATLTGGTAARQVVAEGSPTRSSLIVANCHAEAVSRIVERGGNPAADGSPTRSSLTVANCHCGPGGGVEGDVEPPTVFKFSTVTVAAALGLICCVWREVFGKRGGVKGGLPPVF